MDDCVILMLECIESNQILTKHVYQSVLLRIKIHIYHCRDYQERVNYENIIIKIISSLKKNNIMIESNVYEQISESF